MSKTLEGMALRYKAELGRVIFTEQATPGANEVAMKAALLWLANNVSDEMVTAAITAAFDAKVETQLERDRSAISAALRAAAGGGEK